jgi:protein involved in polysaccharide export with SLBB domain
MVKVGDKIRFTVSHLEGRTGTITSIREIAGIPWYGVKLDGEMGSRGGQYEGMFEVI